jgi:hypothetical protein
MSLVITLVQAAAILFCSLVLGTVFGIWRGYDPATYAPATFVEVHQGAVRGLNTLIPALGGITVVAIVALAIVARDRPVVLWLYGLAFVAMAIGGLVTRFGNQPINEIVMGWSADALPPDWASIRDRWWMFHLTRLGASAAAELLLIAAIFTQRGQG